MPNEKVVQGWREATPEGFRLTLKAPQAITHYARLRDCTAPVARFLKLAATLGPKQGAILFQLPPYLKKDLPLLDAFLSTLPAVRAAFEFRHASWHDDAVYARLRAQNVALCVADSEKLSTPLEITADHGYFRLRDEGYTKADIARWARSIAQASAACEDVFVYFKHEQSGTGPEFARLLLAELGV